MYWLFAFLVARLLGAPLAQSELAMDESGLHYGGRQHVPWAEVSRLGRIGSEGSPRRSGSVWFFAPSWRPAGALRALWAMNRSARLPVSVFDSSMDITAPIEITAENGPHVEVDVG